MRNDSFFPLTYVRGSVTRAITPDYDFRGQACGAKYIWVPQ